MFSIGEVVVVATVALLVFGPKRLPELGRSVGKVMGELKRAMDDVKVQVATEYEKEGKEVSGDVDKLPMNGETLPKGSNSENKEKTIN